MRTRLMLLTLLCGGLTSCGDDDPPYVCGDGVCETTDGENSAECPEDCNDYVCGNEVCETEDGETEDNCPADCLICMTPFSVKCGDSHCWSNGADCASSPIPCGRNLYRCNSEFPYANCCHDTFRLCPAIAPYWCPINKLCYPSWTNCPTTGCTIRGLSCY